MATRFARQMAMATLLLCSPTALPGIAVAADRALGADPVAGCAALSGAGADGPHQPRYPATMPRAGPHRAGRSEGAADPVSAQSAAAVERPLGAIWRRRIQRRGDIRRRPAAGGTVRQRNAAGEGIC